MIRIVAISDTHKHHADITIPECDVLIHAGDFTSGGQPDQIVNFFKWFVDQPAKTKIVVPGNHELTLDRTHKRYSQLAEEMWLAQEDVYRLPSHAQLHDGDEDLFASAIGTPWTPSFCGWGFNGTDSRPNAIQGTKKLGDVYGEQLKTLPNCPVLVSHGPPFGILDKTIRGERVGSHDLLAQIVRARRINESRVAPCHTNLSLVIFGHIHESRGAIKVVGPGRPMTYVNASCMDEDYRVMRGPVIIDYDMHTGECEIEGVDVAVVQGVSSGIPAESLAC